MLGMPILEQSIVGCLDNKVVYAYPCTVRQGVFEADAQQCVIPHDVVTMAALALALQTGAEKIFLCGVDGYSAAIPGEDGLSMVEKAIMNREMEDFLRLLRESNGLADTNLISLTPTAFDITTKSIYAYL